MAQGSRGYDSPYACFCALDPEKLEGVIEGIERLGVGDRLVGVISHVRDVTGRFRRIEVDMSPRGSHLRGMG